MFNRFLFSILPVLLFFMSVQLIRAQSHTEDSLLNLLPAMDDAGKLGAYEHLSAMNSKTNPDKAILYDSLALEILIKRNDLLGISNTLNNIGLGLYAKGDYPGALRVFQESLALKEKIGDTVAIVKSLNNLGVMFQMVGDYDQASDMLFRSLDIRRKQADSAGIARTLSNLSVIYKNSGKTMESLQLLTEAEELYSHLRDTVGLSSVYNNYGTVYQVLEEWDMALYYFQQSLILKQSSNDQRGIANTYNNIGMVQQSLKNFEDARTYYFKALKIRSTIHDRFGLASVFTNIGTMYFDQERFDSANVYLIRAIKIAEAENLLPQLQRAWHFKALVHEKQGSPGLAYQSLQRAYDLRDSVFNRQYAGKMAEMEGRLRIDKTMKENKILKLEQQLNRLSVQRSSNIILIFIGVVILVLIGAYLLWQQLKSKKLINKKLLETNRLLEESESKYKAVVEQSNEAISIHWNGMVLFVNDFFCRLTDFSKDEIYRMSPVDFFYGIDGMRFSAMLTDGLSEDALNHQELRIVTKTGEIKWVNLNQKKITIFGEDAWLCIALDITDSKHTAGLVKKLEQAVRQSPVSITITDSNGNIEYVNNKFCDMSGYTFEEVKGKNTSILKSGKTSPAVYKTMWDTITSGNIWFGELLNKNKKGDCQWVSVSISPILDENQIITHYLSIMEDVTQRKASEEELLINQTRLKEANSTKDKFFSIIAHDLKNPFNAIIGFSNLLVNEYDDFTDEERKEFVSNIQVASSSTFRLLQNLLDWALTQTGSMHFKPVHFDICMAINETLNLSESAAEVKEINMHSQVPFNTTVYADYQMIVTALRNLITNAIKFTPRKGTVVVGYEQASEFLTIFVKDNGVGIPEDQLTKLFRIDEQYRREGTEQEPGTGLGLILCEEFIKMNGGRMWVESSVEIDSQGSTFYFTLPLDSSDDR